jgi:hypothetical protein
VKLWRGRAFGRLVEVGVGVTFCFREVPEMVGIWGCAVLNRFSGSKGSIGG